MAYGFGGAERTTANLLAHLNRSRIQRITLVAPAGLRAYLPEEYDHFVDAAQYQIAGGFSTPHALYRDVQAASTLLRELAPDVALGMMHYASALVVLGARLIRSPIRTVASYRGPFYEYMRRYEPAFGRRLFLRAAVAGTALLADRVIVPSWGTAKELRRRFFTPLSHTVTIPNGIDHKVVERALEQSVAEYAALTMPKSPIVCVAARLAPEKKLDLVLEAFRRVRSILPATLVILGDGPERSRLESQVREWRLDGSVHFLGYRENVYPYLQLADLFVHTCEFEGFGYAILEALACGTAVIATDCPYGPREILGNAGEYGVLTPPDDPAALAIAMLRLLESPAERKLLADRGRQRAEQLSIERMVSAYETVFTSLTSG